MNTQKPELIVTRHWALGRILVFLGLLVGVGVGALAVQQTQEVRSRAASYLLSPSPLVELVPSPDASLIMPYARLVSDKNQYIPTEKATVDIYTHTNNEAIIESRLRIRFDENALEFLEDEVTLHEGFKSFDVEIQNGIILLDLFINPQVGHAPVQTTEEIKVATLTFVTKEVDKKETVIDIEFDTESSESSTMVSLSEAREEKPTNPLKSVVGVAFDIVP